MRAKQWEADDESDWILLDQTDFEEEQQQRDSDRSKRPERERNLTSAVGESSLFIIVGAKARQKEEEERRRRQMALDEADIELIRASWIPARKDPSGSGVLLFKGLFTKFPEYLGFFSQFAELDLERLHENKRLIRHATKVIETVTFVVDSVGDQRKADQLNEALVNLVRSHLKRRIGLAEFRNLGIVIIDFICDLQQRRRKSPPNSRTSSACEHSLESVNSSETEIQEELCTQCHNHNHSHHNQTSPSLGRDPSDSQSSSPQPSVTALDMSSLVTAWTKLYSSILDLVKRESGETDDRS